MTLTLYCVYKYANKNACLFQVNCSLDILKTKTKKQKKKTKTFKQLMKPANRGNMLIYIYISLIGPIC